MVILATLASIELFEDAALPPCLDHKYKIIKVAPDGACFWSCLWLATQATIDEIASWYIRPRGETGFATGTIDSRRESVVVWTWVSGLKDMPPDCRERFGRHASAEEPDIVAPLRTGTAHGIS